MVVKCRCFKPLSESVQAIRASSAPVSLTIRTYNIRVIPLTSYDSQLVPLPKEAMDIERCSLHTVLRLPQKSLRHSDFFHLVAVGVRTPRSMNAACAAALFRTSARTVTSRPEWKRQIQIAASASLPPSSARRRISLPLFLGLYSFRL